MRTNNEGPGFELSWEFKRFSHDRPLKPENSITLVPYCYLFRETKYDKVNDPKFISRNFGDPSTENMHEYRYLALPLSKNFHQFYITNMFLNFGDKIYYLRAQLSLQIESRARVSSHVAQRREKVGIDRAQSRVVSAAQQVLFSLLCALYKFFITAFFLNAPMISNAKTIRECIRDLKCDTKRWDSIKRFFCTRFVKNQLP